VPQSEEPLILLLSNEWAEVLPSQGRGVVELSKIVCFLENDV
jgi:hypothetical protein